MSKLSNEQFEDIVSMVVQNAKEAFDEAKENRNDDFLNGRKQAYYEVLDTIKSQLLVDDANLAAYGLDKSVEEMAG